MSNCALNFPGMYESAGEDTSASLGIDVGTGYTELIAATAMDYEGFWAFATTTATTGVTSVDIGMGAASSEQDLILDLYSSGSTSGHQVVKNFALFLPIRVPEGSRLAARSNASMHVHILGCNGGAGRMNGFAGALTWGAASSRGTAVAGNTTTANTLGAYTEFVASTDRPIKALMLAVGANANIAMTTAGFLINIAIGAGGSEQIIIPNLSVTVNSSGDYPCPMYFGPFPVCLPTGTRIAVALQSSTTTLSDRDLDAIVYGFY